MRITKGSDRKMGSKACEKLSAELAAAKKASDMRAKAVAQCVYDVLTVFCAQEPEFAQAVEQSDKTLGQVCENIMKDVGTSISDLEVYRRAVAEYFPGAVVDCVMTVRMSEHENPSRDPERANRRTSEKKDALSLDLFDLMG